ncbi:MAG: response regulator transcription factor [Saprospiraceae bacterium]|nr:response regulator transcription factor [Saprospiraceae bacterium]
MIRYLIIDDEFMAHEIIKSYCDMLPSLQLMKNCYDALEAFEYLKEKSVDLIFLDLNMPKLKGFEFLRVLAHPPKVIVTTAYAEYAIEGYELDIVDYLLKPFSFERFLKAVNKAIEHTPPSPAMPPLASPPPNEKRIFLQSNKKHTQVIVSHIQYIEAAGNYCKIFIQGEMIMTRSKISDLLSTLPDADFLQVHKSFAVAIKHIQSIEGNRIYIGEHTIPIGKYYKANINKLLRP